MELVKEYLIEKKRLTEEYCKVQDSISQLDKDFEFNSNMKWVLSHEKYNIFYSNSGDKKKYYIDKDFKHMIEHKDSFCIGENILMFLNEQNLVCFYDIEQNIFLTEWNIPLDDDIDSVINEIKKIK